jgi:hypothetical protein
MNARASENYLAISRSSSALKSVEIFWTEIYWGRFFLGLNLENPCVIKVILLACFTYIDIFKFAKSLLTY